MTPYFKEQLGLEPKREAGMVYPGNHGMPPVVWDDRQPAPCAHAFSDVAISPFGPSIAKCVKCGHVA